MFGQLLGGTETQFRAAVASITAISGATIQTGSGSYLDLQLIWAGCSGESAAACRTLPVSSFVAKSDYVAKPFPATAVAGMAKAIEARQGQSGSGAVIMDPYGAAINKVAPDATAFVHRDQLFSCQELAYWSSGGKSAADSWLDWTAGRAAAVRVRSGLPELHRSHSQRLAAGVLRRQPGPAARRQEAL